MGPRQQRKEDWVRGAQAHRRRRQRFEVYYILKSMEEGPSHRSHTPKFRTQDPDYRILVRERKRYTHYYVYIYDRMLGAFCLRVGSFLPFRVRAFVNGYECLVRELFRKRIYGPLSASTFHHRPVQSEAPNCPFEKAYHRLDHALDELIEVIAA